MRIYTSSWFTNLPPEIQKIGVSRGTPRAYPAGYRRMPELAPGPWFQTANLRDYKQLFFESLSKLDPSKTVAKLEDLSAGKDCALLCYEAPQKDADWCHRGYLSAWLQDSLGLDVFEYGMEDRGAGWKHPKIPSQYRHPAKPIPLDASPYIGSTATDRNGIQWTVRGNDVENVDQAMIEAADGRRCAISAEVLKSKFQRII
ncbi:hypothetical protein C7441_11059 [Pseudaminobacter salicylatoxidans]|uniref:DUF488 domain-containing protein n=1 Tax=Pseudaminobacter salicylatoxidans TaxID=93369 RepID=A0A316C2F0_PSESE|nr:DUF488 domain-containing protein [Pseudaminobacter salicylatoxidans]PWJ81527.1 hypothetical protein C7441_11059 [Pseudaminobacter salicylatoxidans]